jgi:hypothetical protein
MVLFIRVRKVTETTVSFVVSLRLSVRPSSRIEKENLVGVFSLSFILEITLKPASKMRVT